jgi:hypothetical protein
MVQFVQTTPALSPSRWSCHARARKWMSWIGALSSPREWYELASEIDVLQNCLFEIIAS